MISVVLTAAASALVLLVGTPVGAIADVGAAVPARATATSPDRVGSAATRPAASRPVERRPTSRRIDPRRTYATIDVPAAGIRRLRIVRYQGTPDDRVGTRINDAGRASAPHGRWGGVAPGQVGNFFLAGHRISAGAPMLKVPGLKVGQTITVRRGSQTFVYTVAYRLRVNFRRAGSRALQTAAVPGHPGRRATRPAIVLSTCATPEDRAAGLPWRDRFGNPTHRIAVVGFLQPVP